MKKTISIILCASVFAGTQAQDVITGLMPDVPQSIGVNPAKAISFQGFFYAPVPIPNVSVDASFGYRLDEIFRERNDGSGALTFNLRDLYKNCPGDKAKVHLGMDFGVLGFGFGTNIGEFSFNCVNKTTFDIHVPKDAFNAIDGNYEYDNYEGANKGLRKMSLTDFYLSGINYTEYALTYALDVPTLDWLRAGITLKLLAGSLAVLSDNLVIDVETRERTDEQGNKVGNGYEINFVTQGGVKTSAPLKIKEDKRGYVDDYEVDEFKIGDVISPSGNTGFAMNLGVAARLLDNKLLVDFSVRDIAASIKWGKNAKEFQLNNTFIYRGLDISDNVGDSKVKRDGNYFDELVDTLKSFKNLKCVEQGDFKTKIGPKFFLSGEYLINNFLSGAFVWDAKINDGKLSSSEILSVSYRPNHHFNGILQLGLRPNARFAMGLGLQAMGGPFQFTIMSDRIPLGTKAMTGAQFSIGVNWVVDSTSKCDKITSNFCRSIQAAF